MSFQSIQISLCHLKSVLNSHKSKVSCLISAGLPPKGTPMQVSLCSQMISYLNVSEISHCFQSYTAAQVSSWFPLFQMSRIEEEIDRMNEAFLQLSVQLQKRAHMSTWQKEKENSSGNHSVVISWNITIYKSYLFKFLIPRKG